MPGRLPRGEAGRRRTPMDRKRKEEDAGALEYADIAPHPARNRVAADVAPAAHSRRFRAPVARQRRRVATPQNAEVSLGYIEKTRALLVDPNACVPLTSLATRPQ